MKSNPRILALLCGLACAGCYGRFAGRVLDAETTQPIEGAIVVVQWWDTKGIPGLAYHVLARSVETETDKEGAFSLEGGLDAFMNEPAIAIYKEGYVCWREHDDFVTGERRKGSQYGSDVTIKLDRFKPEYSRTEHSYYMDRGLSVDSRSKFGKAASAEDQAAQTEIDERKQREKNNPLGWR